MFSQVKFSQRGEWSNWRLLLLPTQRTAWCLLPLWNIRLSLSSSFSLSFHPAPSLLVSRALSQSFGAYWLHQNLRGVSIPRFPTLHRGSIAPCTKRLQAKFMSILQGHVYSPTRTESAYKHSTAWGVWFISFASSKEGKVQVRLLKIILQTKDF